MTLSLFSASEKQEARCLATRGTYSNMAPRAGKRDDDDDDDDDGDGAEFARPSKRS